jgi:signal transduction histidine kinase
MRFELRNKLAVKLTIQMIAVVVIIASTFYFIIYMQTREMEKRIFDKANLFSLILGANLDKIVGDNLIAYNQLQEATSVIAKDEEVVEEIKVIAPEYIILSSSLGEGIWEPVQAQYLDVVKEVVSTNQSKSIVKTALGKEQVIHFMPIFGQKTADEQLIGVMQIIVRFPSQQVYTISSLRSNMSAYFKEEAAGFANKLANSLQDVLDEAQRNFNYLESLINNMLLDEEIQDVKLFSKDLRLLGSGSSGRRVGFIADGQNTLYSKVMDQQTVMTSEENQAGHLIEVVSPLYLTTGAGREIGGAVGITLSLTRIQKLISERRNNILIMGLVIIAVFCLLIGLFFRTNVLNPTMELAGLMEKVGDGDFSGRSKIRSDNEIGRLAGAFNRMTDELEKSKQEIQEWNLRLQERVDRVSKELKQKQAKLVESEKMVALGALSSGIAHEINNPLGIILGHTQMLLKEFKTKGNLQTPQEAQKLLEAIQDNTKRCSHIVNSLLQFAKKKDLQFQDTDVMSSIENALVFTSNRLSQKGIEITKDFQPKLPLVSADPIQLEQVFINIILNSEQSMPNGGRIKISAGVEPVKEAKPKFISLVFEDTGEGIPQEVLGRIFDPFFSTKEPGEGAGLGLSVSYGIIRAHGGDIEAKSQIGIGTVITVKLPLRKKV